MPSKKEISDRLNEIFEVKINFENLTKEDLETLLKVVDDPSNLLRITVEMARERGKKEVIETLEKVTKRPLLDLFKELKKGDVVEEEKGFFGLGLFPAARQRLRELTDRDRDKKQ